MHKSLYRVPLYAEYTHTHMCLAQRRHVVCVCVYVCIFKYVCVCVRVRVCAGARLEVCAHTLSHSHSLSLFLTISCGCIPALRRSRITFACPVTSLISVQLSWLYLFNTGLSSAFTNNWRLSINTSYVCMYTYAIRVQICRYIGGCVCACIRAYTNTNYLDT